MANLFYVVGASGVGKDSLLSYARKNLQSCQGIVFAHRYITRVADAGGENHIELSEQEFAHRQHLGCFAMHWRSHGINYGIGTEIDHWLDIGLSVVVNGSRAYLAEATQNYPHLIPILVTATPERLRQRLSQRGREQGEELELRLRRNEQFERALNHPRLIRISNNGELSQAGQLLLDVLLGNVAPLCV